MGETWVVQFNVEEGDGRTYGDFIEVLRQRLTVSHSYNDLPVLIRQECRIPTQWFHIDLQTSGTAHAVRVRIRPDNLYVIGYRMANGQWLEYGMKNDPNRRHVIQESDFLDFLEDYSSMQEATAGERHRRDIPLGQSALVDAVEALATSEDKPVRALSLIVVCQMICESVRFINISDLLITTFGQNLPPPEWMVLIVISWVDLSDALLHYVVGSENTFRLRRPNVLKITTADQAAFVLGILKGGRFRHRCMVAIDDNDGEYDELKGRPLAEVFSVGFNGEDTVSVYGTITVTDGLGSQYLYNRKREDAESITALLLTGPNAYISAFLNFTIDVALSLTADSSSPVDEASKGQISWDVFDTNNKYDQAIYEEVMNGRYGINYAVYSDAVEATVVVTLLSGAGKDPASVYGLITACNDIIHEKQSVIFYKEKGKEIDASRGKPIPLSRSAVAVPLGSNLKLAVELYERDPISSDEKEIAKATIHFSAQVSGTNQRDIYGTDGGIQVEVTWA